MTGIVSYGAYIPIYRLSRDIIGKEWGLPGSGEKAVSNYDEDSLSMGVEAAIDCLRDFDRRKVDCLLFASTTAPYREKQAASIVAAALDLRPNCFTVDFGNSLRAGTSALRLAFDMVKGGSAQNVLVVAADCRLPAPATDNEMTFGDGAAAVLVGKTGAIASLEGARSSYSEYMGTWKNDSDRYIQSWEDRPVAENYLKCVKENVSALLAEQKLAAAGVARAALYAPDARRHGEVARELGLNPKAQMVDGLFDRVGNTGAASPLLLLASALENGKASERLLVVGFGDGSDAFVFQTTDKIAGMNGHKPVKKYLDSKMALSSYGKYAKFRNLMQFDVERRPQDHSASTILERDRRMIYPLMAQKCKKCGGVQYAIMSHGRVCTWCQAQDQFEEVPFANKKGTIFTYSLDERAMEVDLPNVLCMVDMDGGGRFFSQMTDRDPQKITVGMRVEPTFRRIHQGSGMNNYFWKVRPLRG